MPTNVSLAPSVYTLPCTENWRDIQKVPKAKNLKMLVLQNIPISDYAMRIIYSLYSLIYSPIFISSSFFN